MIDHPFDFSPLDPLRDPLALDARVGAIARDAVIPPASDLFAELSAWARPLLAAAAVVSAIAAYPLVRARPSQPPRGVSTAEILGVPSAVVELARSSAPPSVAQLAEALNAEQANAR